MYMYTYIIVYICICICIYKYVNVHTHFNIFMHVLAQIGTGQIIADWAEEEKDMEMDRIVRHVCVLHTQSVVHFAQPKSEANNRHV